MLSATILFNTLRIKYSDEWNEKFGTKINQHMSEYEFIFTIYCYKFDDHQNMSVSAQGHLPIHISAFIRNLSSSLKHFNPYPAEPGYVPLLPTVWIQISWLLKKPSEADLAVLSPLKVQNFH